MTKNTRRRTLAIIFLGVLGILLILGVTAAGYWHYVTYVPPFTPRWLPTVPQDCWDQPLRYRLVAGKPLLYSLGPDGQDDGGQAADPVRLTPQTRGDLVFGRLSRGKR